MTMPDIPSELINIMRDARHVVVLTGAGVSAESGVPTFRDALEGLWANFNPEQLATPEAFAEHPERVSRWYGERCHNALRCKPNPGHHALVRMEQWLFDRSRSFTLLTQNVDRLHQRAGNKNVFELHGSLLDWRCATCSARSNYAMLSFADPPPRCTCGGPMRPDVVWFGETLPENALRAADRALRQCDLFFSIGTSAQVYPAAGFIHAACTSGTVTCEINPQPTPMSDRIDFVLPGPSGQILPKLVNHAFGAEAGAD